jgi:hypothetical protein
MKQRKIKAENLFRTGAHLFVPSRDSKSESLNFPVKFVHNFTGQAPRTDKKLTRSPKNLLGHFNPNNS